MMPAPTRRWRAAFLALSLVTASVAISGCSLFGEGDDASNDVNKDAANYKERPIDQIYNDAWKQINQGDWENAAKQFDEMERQHPYSVWARRAQLMGAYSYYLDRDYTKSIESAQRFLSIHPGNRDAAYAYYLIALSYYEQITDVTRDQKITTQAQDSLGELVRRYPNTR